MTFPFKTPFADAGDRQAIPETDLSGAVNFIQGYSPDYELDPDTDPSAKLIERDKFNYLMNVITAAIGEMQRQGVAAWYADLAPYAAGVMVFHGGNLWRSNVAGNMSEPGFNSDWFNFIPGVAAWGDITGKPAVIAAGADAAAARAAIGAGTSNLVIGNGPGDAKAGNYAPPNAGPVTAGVIKSRVAGGVWYVTTDGSNP